MQINVTQSDIWLGIRGDSWSCPIVLATLRAMKRHHMTKHHGISVTSACLRIWDPDYDLVYIDLPARVQEWIAHFDEFGDVSPIRFDVEIPNAVA